MVELLCAIVVLNLLVAGLASMFRGQNQVVNSLEEWCEGDPVLYVSPDSNPMSRTLGVPATLSKKDSVREVQRSVGAVYAVEVLEMKRRFSKNQASVVFSQEKKEDNERNGKGDGDDDENEEDS